MASVRIALANLPYPSDREEAIALTVQGIRDAGGQGALAVCFPECFVPGYRSPSRHVPEPDPVYLERAWSAAAGAAAQAGVTAIVGTERLVDGGLRACTVVIASDGSIAGIQDKIQLDPSEDGLYEPGDSRRVFGAGPLTFGVAICHEGWRYPETVRWAVRRGAQVVFHPHFHEAEADSYRPSTFADPANTFHEKALLCRAAENTCYIASVNYAGNGSPTTSAIVDPDGRVVAWQPYGLAGLLVADLDLDRATGHLAKRLRIDVP
jgi:predicted amidohydrolase